MPFPFYPPYPKLHCSDVDPLPFCFFTSHICHVSREFVYKIRFYTFYPRFTSRDSTMTVHGSELTGNRHRHLLAGIADQPVNRRTHHVKLTGKDC